MNVSGVGLVGGLRHRYSPSRRGSRLYYSRHGMVFVLVNALLTVLLVVATIAYFTLFERKLLAATQRRRGPSVVGF